MYMYSVPGSGVVWGGCVVWRGAAVAPAVCPRRGCRVRAFAQLRSRAVARAGGGNFLAHPLWCRAQVGAAGADMAGARRHLQWSNPEAMGVGLMVSRVAAWLEKNPSVTPFPAHSCRTRPQCSAHPAPAPRSLLAVRPWRSQMTIGSHAEHKGRSAMQRCLQPAPSVPAPAPTAPADAPLQPFGAGEPAAHPHTTATPHTQATTSAVGSSPVGGAAAMGGLVPALALGGVGAGAALASGDRPGAASHEISPAGPVEERGLAGGMKAQPPPPLEPADSAGEGGTRALCPPLPQCACAPRQAFSPAHAAILNAR
jgi:hypothetical protein